MLLDPTQQETDAPPAPGVDDIQSERVLGGLVGFIFGIIAMVLIDVLSKH